MRIRVAHETTYRYETPAKGVIQILRLTPRNHDGQQVLDWRIDVSADCRLDQLEDAFGNITHTFTADGPFESVTVGVDGTVDTQDMQGLVQNAVEPFPPSLFLRETPLTQPDEAIATLSSAIRRESGGDDLEFLHTLLTRLHGEMAFDSDPTHSGTTAADAYKLRRGVCQDFTHIFVAAARSAGIPARYIGGHYCRADVVIQDAGHAWAEAYVADLGWLGFDPTHGICPVESHVRVAAGLDYLGAAPVRGTRYGGAGESLAVNIRVEQAKWQSQN
ncbi:MAG: transglutaminase family protein [Xanthobacteraceae bacterium]